MRAALQKRHGFERLERELVLRGSWRRPASRLKDSIERSHSLLSDNNARG